MSAEIFPPEHQVYRFVESAVLRHFNECESYEQLFGMVAVVLNRMVPNLSRETTVSDLDRYLKQAIRGLEYGFEEMGA